MSVHVNSMNVNIPRHRCAECGGPAGPSVVTMWPEGKPVRFCPKCAVVVAVRLVDRARLCTATGG